MYSIYPLLKNKGPPNPTYIISATELSPLDYEYCCQSPTSARQFCHHLCVSDQLAFSVPLLCKCPAVQELCLPPVCWSSTRTFER